MAGVSHTKPVSAQFLEKNLVKYGQFDKKVIFIPHKTHFASQSYIVPDFFCVVFTCVSFRFRKYLAVLKLRKLKSSFLKSSFDVL